MYVADSTALTQLPMPELVQSSVNGQSAGGTSVRTFADQQVLVGGLEAVSVASDPACRPWPRCSPC